MALLGITCHSKAEMNKIPNFSLMGTSGKVYTQADFDDNEFWLSFSCLTTARFQLFQNHINDLSKQFEKEATILAISPNCKKAILPDELAYSDLGDSFEEMKKRAIRLNYNFPYLYDGEKQHLTRAIGVKITPTVYLYDEKRELFRWATGNIDSPDKRRHLNSIWPSCEPWKKKKSRSREQRFLEPQ